GAIRKRDLAVMDRNGNHYISNRFYHCSGPQLLFLVAYSLYGIWDILYIHINDITSHQHQKHCKTFTKPPVRYFRTDGSSYDAACRTDQPENEHQINIHRKAQLIQNIQIFDEARGTLHSNDNQAGTYGYMHRQTAQQHQGRYNHEAPAHADQAGQNANGQTL